MYLPIFKKENDEITLTKIQAEMQNIYREREREKKIMVSRD
jgi:hypothetical protein